MNYVERLVTGQRPKELWYALKYNRKMHTNFSKWNVYAKKKLYWGGINRGAAQVYKKGMELICDGAYWDLQFIKIPTPKERDFAILWGELEDMILPYVTHTLSERMSKYCVEGPYENFGVKVEKDDVVFDIGANMGIFSAFAVKYRQARVVSFEPADNAREILQKTINLNNMKNSCIIEPYACGAISGKMNMIIDRKNIGGSRLEEVEAVENAGAEKQEVQLVSIDEYLKNNTNGVKTVNFIKADIEGSERQMLQGAQETMRTFKPKLAICLYHLPDDKEVLTDLILRANPEYKINYTKHKLYAY